MLRTRRFFLALVLALLPIMALPAHADGLDSAKAAGLVGERPDGMLGVVTATPEATAIVADVNARRLAKFKDIAAKNGQSLAAVQAVAGQEFIARTPAGQFIMNAAGVWVRK